MALLKMSRIKSPDFEKACTACQMAFGCVICWESGCVLIAAFSYEDGEVILDTLSQVGSVYLGTWRM